MAATTLKLVVVGERKCGKTALVVRFLTGKFIHEYATGEDVLYPHSVLLPSHEVRLKIMDTCNNIITSSLVDADGIIIVYAVNNMKSFRRAKDILLHVQAVGLNNSCIAIVANKSDMWQYRSVMQSDGEYLAKKHGCKYFELSALNDREGVDRMFNVVVKLINDQRAAELKCTSVILFDKPPRDFESRQRSRSLQLPKENKKTTQKSPILFRRILKTWSNSSLNRSKSTEKLTF